ncbi:MAG: GreA/GreB family elongation factor, partial [Planctomycetota bacterium]
RIVGHLRAARPDDWPEVLVELLPGAPVAACDAIASALVESGRPDLLRGPIDTILARPDRCPAALAWLWRAAAGADPPGPVAEVDRAAVALGLLSAAATLGRRKARPSEQRRGLLHEVRNAVGFRSYGPLADVLAKVSDERAGQIKTRLERHTGLSENAVRRIRQLLLKTHHELFVEHVDPWEEDAVYTTETGLRRHREELSHLANEKLAAASKAVGKAAQMGDLSENAEWAAALEARDRLAARAERMQNEINKAKIITREMAESDTVTIGSAVEARDVETDERQTFTFLGPWDVDHENGVHSYRAGFGRAFMGHKVGDRVTVDADGGSRAWEIVAITPGV